MMLEAPDPASETLKPGSESLTAIFPPGYERNTFHGDKAKRTPVGKAVGRGGVFQHRAHAQ
jgi:hypothetical protein